VLDMVKVAKAADKDAKKASRVGAAATPSPARRKGSLPQGGESQSANPRVLRSGDAANEAPSRDLLLATVLPLCNVCGSTEFLAGKGWIVECGMCRNISCGFCNHPVLRCYYIFFPILLVLLFNSHVRSSL
jgi:hypothetical protein